jgi:glutamate--cysteine ligase
VQSLALELLEWSGAGLQNRKRLNSSGDNETGFLAPLHETAESGKTPAEIKLDRFNTAWAGSVDPVFTECAY